MTTRANDPETTQTRLLVAELFLILLVGGGSAVIFWGGHRIGREGAAAAILIAFIAITSTVEARARIAPGSRVPSRRLWLGRSLAVACEVVLGWAASGAVRWVSMVVIAALYALAEFAPLPTPAGWARRAPGGPSAGSRRGPIVQMAFLVGCGVLISGAFRLGGDWARVALTFGYGAVLGPLSGRVNYPELWALPHRRWAWRVFFVLSEVMLFTFGLKAWRWLAIGVVAVAYPLVEVAPLSGGPRRNGPTHEQG